MNEQLTQWARNVATTRTALAEMQAEYKERLAEFEAANAGLIESINVLKLNATQFEDELREMALAEYADTGAKKLPHGIGIRVTTKLAYDEAQALEWAKSHGLALKLDAKSFEKIAKADPNSLTLTYTGEVVNIVQVVEVPTVTLPTDTAKLLEA